MRYLRSAGRDRVEDPAVERLFEGMAFLMGCVEKQRLDDDLPELTEVLLEYFCFVDVCGFDILQLPENKSQFSI